MKDSSLKNLLVVIQTGTFGGPHNQVCKMNSLLLEAGWKQFVVLPDDTDEETLTRFEKEQIAYRLIPIPRLRKTLNFNPHVKFLLGFKRVIDDLSKIIEEFDIDMVQNCGLMSLHAGFAAQKKGKPVVWQLLSTFAPPSLRLILTNLVVNQANVVMSTGEITARSHAGWEKFEDRLVPFYPPVDTKNFLFSDEDHRAGKALLGVESTDLVIGTVGNQNRQKNHRLFVDVAANFLSRKNVKFRIVGRANQAQATVYERSVIQHAQNLGVSENDKLRIEEPTGDIRSYLAGFDVFLLTSIAEGVPTAVLEAMAAGIPVVATRVGGLAEIIDIGRTGYLAECGDQEGLRKSLEALIGDFEKRQKIGENCRERALADFDISSCVASHLKAYDKALIWSR